jgi:hypothetical protein
MCQDNDVVTPEDEFRRLAGLNRSYDDRAALSALRPLLARVRHKNEEGVPGVRVPHGRGLHRRDDTSPRPLPGSGRFGMPRAALALADTAALAQAGDRVIAAEANRVLVVAVDPEVAQLPQDHNYHRSVPARIDPLNPNAQRSTSFHLRPECIPARDMKGIEYDYRVYHIHDPAVLRGLFMRAER